MIKKGKYLLMLATASLAILACKQDDGGESDEPIEAPKLLYFSPTEAYVVSGSSFTLQLCFDQNVKVVSGAADNIRIEPAATISKVWAYDELVSISIEALESGTSYTLTIPHGTIYGWRDNQETVPAINYSFSTKKKEGEEDYERNPAKSLTNPQASPEAKALYAALLNIYGSKTLSGAVGGDAWDMGFSDYVASQANCGKYPAVIGFDYLFMHYQPHIWGVGHPPDYADISLIEKAYNQGNIIHICWHWNMPKSESDFPDHPENYRFYVADFEENNVFSIKDALAEGTWQKRALDYYIERLAGYLSKLQNAGIPVLFRPLHEAAGDYGWKNPWFWWGFEGPEQYVKLWKYLRDALQETYHLNNLIWVYTMQTLYNGTLAPISEMEPWYPGDDYVDIVGCDLYESKNTTCSVIFKRVNNSVKGTKMVALSECGNLLDFEKSFEEDAPWLYYMTWSSKDGGNWTLYSNYSDGSPNWSNTPEDWKKALTGHRILNRGELIY
jgi:mannan endo-1,4-beta-mannosidase